MAAITMVNQFDRVIGFFVIVDIGDSLGIESHCLELWKSVV